MSEFLHFVGSSVSPSSMSGLIDRWETLLLSGDVLVWIFVISILRFDVPAFVTWIVNLVNPRAFRPPSGPDAFLPMVSVVIAGRNPGAGISKTIRSVLDSGYPNVEVIFADDFSTDDTLVHARAFERTGRVRVFASAQHNGKPSNLNIALHMARGDLAFVLDADAEVEFGTIHRLVEYFRDPNLGAVTANILVRNASQNLLTRLQEIEYALNNSIARLWRSAIGLLPILPGAATMFRVSALRDLGGYDTGLGDDTDMTVRMRKKRWRIAFAIDARIYTDEPSTAGALYRQRVRWQRNMVKVRLHKHLDLISPSYGWDNTIVAIDHLMFRVILPLWAIGSIFWGLVTHPGERTIVFTSLYCLTVFFVACKCLIANDLCGSPPFGDLFLVPIYLPYRFLIRSIEAVATVREFLRIRLYHPYVPKRIWEEIPHW